MDFIKIVLTFFLTALIAFADSDRVHVDTQRVRMLDLDRSHEVVVESPADLTQDTLFVFPPTNGAANQCIASVDGTGTTQYQTVLLPSQTATGDLSGTLISPTVVGLQGNAVLSTTPTNTQLLQFNGTQWAPSSPSVSGDLTGSLLSPTVQALQGVSVAPTAPLNGEALVYSNANSRWEPGVVTGGGGVTIGNAVTGGNANAVIFEDGSNNLGSSTNFTFDETNERLGIGVATPLANLQVSEATAATEFAVHFTKTDWGTTLTDGLLLESIGNNARLRFYEAGDLTLNTQNGDVVANPSDDFRVISSGGGASYEFQGDADAHFRGGAAATTTMCLQNNATGITDTDGFCFNMGTTFAELRNFENGAITATTDGNFRVRDAAGNTHIDFNMVGNMYQFKSGTDTEIELNSADGLIEITDDDGFQAIDFKNSILDDFDNRLSASTTGMILWTNGTQALSVNNSQNVRIYGLGSGDVQSDASGNLFVSSDRRLKENIRDWSHGYSAIKRLSPKEYDFREDSGINAKNVVGFIAQEVDPVIPQAIGKEKKHFSLKTQPILAAAVNALKEQIKINKEIKKELAKVKKRVTKLESK